MNEKIYSGDHYEVIHKFEPASSDRRKLLVVFSGGFGTRKHYDFDGPSSKAIKCNILWIRDSFEGNFTYYIRNARGFAVSDDIQGLISHYLEILGITKNEVIITGFSKGGTAALYHGMKYGYPNIISTVPRIRIGSANQHRRPPVYHYLIGEPSLDKTISLDSILPDVLASDKQLDRNVYLFSSESDRQYKREIIPVLPLLRRYENFNFVLTSSRLVRRHHEVTRYNLPLIISIINSLVENIVPRFGEISNGNAHVDEPLDSHGSSVQDFLTPVGAITSFNIENGGVRFKGYAFNGEIDTTSANIETKLEFRPCSGDASVLSIPVKNELDESLDIKYYTQYFRSHAHGAFTNPPETATDISSLNPGTYIITIDCKHGDSHFVLTDVFNDERTRWIQDREFLYMIGSRKRSLILKKYVLTQILKSTTDTFFRSTYAQDNGVLRLRGHFAIRGIEVAQNPHYFRYRLLLTSTITGNPELLIPLKTRSGSLANEYFSDPFHDYTRSRFVLDASVSDVNLRVGQYKMSVLLLTENDVFRYPTDHIFEKK